MDPHRPGAPGAGSPRTRQHADVLAWIVFRRSKVHRELIPGTAFGRSILNLPLEFLDQPFELVEVASGRRIAHQILTLDDPLAAQPLAAHRWALGQVEKHPTIFPFHIRGHLLELAFIAEDVPPVEYKIFRLVPVSQGSNAESDLQIGPSWLENRFYRVELDAGSGAVSSLYDKVLEREWVYPGAAWGVNQLLIRSPINGEIARSGRPQISTAINGPVMASLVVKADAPGCPQLTQEITLYADLQRIDFSNRLLKDATPLSEYYFAFPFAFQNPQFISMRDLVQP